MRGKLPAGDTMGLQRIQRVQRVQRMLRVLMVVAAGAVGALAQIVPSSNAAVNRVAEQINAANGQYLKQKYGGVTAADPEKFARKLQEAVICTAMSSPADGEILTFIVPVSSDQVLQQVWMPKVLAECKKYPLADLGVRLINIESGLSMAVHRHLLVHLPSMQTELGWAE